MTRYCLAIVCMILVSCGGSDLPKGVLTKDEMRKVLWDVMRADELAIRKPVDSLGTLADNYTGFYQQVFALNKITKEDFRKSLLYYEEHPEVLKPILDSLQKRVDSSGVKAGPPVLPKKDTAVKKDTLQTVKKDSAVSLKNDTLPVVKQDTILKKMRALRRQRPRLH